MQLFERAINNEVDDVAMNNLAYLFHASVQWPFDRSLRAKQLYERSIDGSKFPAIYHLANLLKEGANGVNADPAREVKLYERGVDEEGSAYVKIRLACILKDGADGVEPDPARAAELFERAIDQEGFVGTMNCLADILANGFEGQERDIQRAVQLYERVIDEEANSVSMNNLALLLQGGTEAWKRIPQGHCSCTSAPAMEVSKFQ